MRNLLINAVEELVVRVNRELELIRQEIKITTATKGDKLIILNQRRNTILRLLDKIDYLKEQAEIRFPEEYIFDRDLDKFNHITNIQLEDILNIINEAGIVIEY